MDELWVGEGRRFRLQSYTLDSHVVRKGDPMIARVVVSRLRAMAFIQIGEHNVFNRGMGILCVSRDGQSPRIPWPKKIGFEETDRRFRSLPVRSPENR